MSSEYGKNQNRKRGLDVGMLAAASAKLREVVEDMYREDRDDSLEYAFSYSFDGDLFLQAVTAWVLQTHHQEVYSSFEERENILSCKIASIVNAMTDFVEDRYNWKTCQGYECVYGRYYGY